jgi:glycosyl transferase, family 25
MIIFMPAQESSGESRIRSSPSNRRRVQSKLAVVESASMTIIAALFKRLNRNVRLRFFGDIPAFVILLECDQERRSHVHRNVLPKLPICDVVNATNAVKVEVDKFLHHEKIFVDNNYTHVTSAKLACTISHMRAWKAIVAQNLRHAIVLEDDVAIRDGFSLFIRKLKRQLPVNFDLVHLYVHDRSEWLRQVANSGHLTSDDNFSRSPYVSYIPKCGRSAYLLSRSGAEKLLLGFQTITRAGDCQISEMAQRGKLSVYCARESYVDNLGQLTWQYNGERFRSNIWPIDEGEIPPWGSHAFAKFRD